MYRELLRARIHNTIPSSTKLMHMYIVVGLALAVLTMGTVAFDQPDIPLNWTTAYACAVDFGSRIIAGDITVQDPNNTPASCVERCDAQNFIYAGVEFSNECHCGTGLKSTPEARPHPSVPITHAN